MNQCYDSFRLKILATLVLMCLFLAGCAAPTQGGQAVLDSPCDAPCWQNITPGETQSEPLVELLEAVPDMEKSQIVRLPKWNRYDEIVHFNFEDQKVEGEIFLIDHVAYKILMVGDLKLSLEQLFVRYGEPEIVIVDNTMVPGALGGDGIVLDIFLVYPQKGAAFSFHNSDLDHISINPKLLIKSAIYSDPNNILNEVLSDLGTFEESKRQGRVFDWNGYQEFDFRPKH